jgi:hypothetical protein
MPARRHLPRVTSTAGEAELPRLAFRVPGELAEALGTSVDFVDRHVRPELKLVRRGALVLVAQSEVEAWLSRSATRVLDEIGS